MALGEAPRILGVYLSSTGDVSKRISISKTKADTFALHLKSPLLKASDALLFHQTIYVPTMRYSLATLAVDEECLNPIQTRLLPSILQKTGVNRHLPAAICHGSYIKTNYKG